MVRLSLATLSLAAVVLSKEAEVSATELRTFLGDRVARWWLPERWTFIDEVPRTSVGKFDKKLIRSLYADDTFNVIHSSD